MGDYLNGYLLLHHTFNKINKNSLLQKYLNRLIIQSNTTIYLASILCSSLHWSQWGNKKGQPSNLWKATQNSNTIGMMWEPSPPKRYFLPRKIAKGPPMMTGLHSSFLALHGPKETTGFQPRFWEVKYLNILKITHMNIFTDLHVGKPISFLDMHILWSLTICDVMISINIKIQIQP